MDWFQPAALWYLTTTLATLAFAPFVLMLFSTVTDRGTSVARPIAAIMITWPVWLLASIGDGIVPFGRTSLWITIAIIAVVAWIIGLRTGSITRAALLHLGVAELGFLVLFAGYIWLHGYVSGVTGPLSLEQEKPSDLMMLSSAMQADSMPPNDAWLSGETVNYYYIGYAIWAGVAKMIGTTPAIAFNLALATTFAMTVVAATGTVANILSRFTRLVTARMGGLLGACLIVLIGNPWATLKVIQDVSGQWKRWAFDGIFWHATRVITDTPNPNDTNISEFPAFSFLLADLHPHLLAMPFTIVAVAFAWRFASAPRNEHPARHLVIQVAAGICVVGLYGINSWDFPTWFLVLGGAMLVSPAYPTLGRRAMAVATSLVAGLLAWLPFILDFDAPVNTSATGSLNQLDRVPAVGGVLASIVAYADERTSPSEYLSIFGFFYPVLVVLIVMQLFAPGDTAPDPLINRLAWASAIIVALIGLLLPAPLMIMVGLPALGGVVVLLRSTNLTLGVIATALATLSFVLTLIPEFFYVLDIYGRRMNTVFKIYLQVWTLSAVAAALTLILLWRLVRPSRPGQAMVALVMATIVLGGLVFPVVSGSQWLESRNPDHEWRGLDGLAFLESRDPASYHAIQWLWDNASEDDVVLAAGGCEWYSDLGRPSAATGIPAIIGWDGHERQWHLGDDTILSQLPERVAAINDLFNRPSDDLLDEYGVTLMYIGRAETDGVPVQGGPGATCAPGPFPEATSPEFPGPGWTEVFNEDGVRILRRDGDS